MLCSPERAMATHSSTLAWKIAWMEAPVGCSPWGRNWATSLSLFTFIHWRRKWQPTPAFLPGGMAEPGGLLSMGSHRVGHDWSDLAVAAAAAAAACCVLSNFFFLMTAIKYSCWKPVFNQLLFYHFHLLNSLNQFPRLPSICLIFSGSLQQHLKILLKANRAYWM